MKNREVYDRDPRDNTLLNKGVAKVTTGRSDSELETLRFELKNFVCDGQYAEGLSRILSAYLGNLDKSEQPGVWVSGFFGSGKSHLVKMLQYLWTDFTFPDGAKARGLAKVPQAVAELLKEQSNAARRHGGVHSVAGSLGTAAAGKSVRLELLGLVFQSVGLPAHYHTGSFVLWLRREGLEEAVKQHVAAAGRQYDLELSNLYVSDALAKAILASRPEFANSAAEVKKQIQVQFPERNDVSLDDMIKAMKQALAPAGKLPLTIIILDEVQQYIAESQERSKAVQDLQEMVSSLLGANVMFVATGQNALSGTALLQRLHGRFPLTVELQDTDVEKVTREVVLKKKPTAEPIVRKLLETHSGEIERHLAGTKIAFTARDRVLLPQDYPLLPVRRRLWERVLRAVDKAGTGAQLRTQLWIVYEAVEMTADLPLGNVVSSAFLFNHIHSRVLQSNVLLPEIAETIAKQRDEEDGELRHQLCAMIFLIGQLPHEGPNDPSIRADANTLADLLVTDLNVSSGELRKKIPELLEKLVVAGAVNRVEDEYRMQTREGSEWNQAYLESVNKLMNDSGKMAGERSQLLRTTTGEMLEKRKLVHGVSKEGRRFDVHFGAEPPPQTGASVPVWIRDGWEVGDKAVLADARAAGDAAAVVYGYIPQKYAEELKRAVAGYYAANSTLQLKGSPSTPEGIEAKKAMETRLEQARRSRDAILSDVLNEAAVYIAGGDQVPGLTLETKVQDAAKACLDRLYPLFHQADHPDWHKVYERAKKGDGDPLTKVGHNGNAESHPVCTAILSFVGSGKKGTEIRKQFQDKNYGWPRDAVDAALIVLVNAGLLQARSGNEVVTKDKIDQQSITTIDFRVENITLSKIQLIEIRKLFGEVGVPVQVGQESAKVPAFLADLYARASAAGGEAPLPHAPSAKHLEDLSNRVGNDQLKAIHDDRELLRKQAAEWQKKAELIAQRRPNWRNLTELRMHAAALPVISQVQAEIDEINTSRKLLIDPDPVPGLVDQLTQALREALNHVQAECQQRFATGNAALAASPTWGRLKSAHQSKLLGTHQITDLPEIAVGTVEEVLSTLRDMRLKERASFRDALPTRFEQAMQEAAQLLEPKAQKINLSHATIKDEADLKTWLELAEHQIREKLKEGPVIL